MYCMYEMDFARLMSYSDSQNSTDKLQIIYMQRSDPDASGLNTLPNAVVQLKATKNWF